MRQITLHVQQLSQVLLRFCSVCIQETNQTMCFLWPPDLETIERDMGNTQKYLQEFPFRCFTRLSCGQPALTRPALT